MRHQEFNDGLKSAASISILMFVSGCACNYEDAPAASSDSTAREPVPEISLLLPRGQDSPAIGLRQVAISVNQAQQPAHLVPGDVIDLLGIFPSGKTHRYLKVMEGVEVVAVGERYIDAEKSPRQKKYRSIVINIHPEHVRSLFLVMDRAVDQEFQIAFSAPKTSAGEGTLSQSVLEELELLAP